MNSQTTDKVGAIIESGNGKILAVTDQWIIHDAPLDQRSEEYALLIKEDRFSIFPNGLSKKMEAGEINWICSKMHLLSLILFVLLPLVAVSQEKKNPDPPIWGVQIGNAGIWAYQEIDLSKSTSLRNEVGFDTGAHGYNMQYLSGLTITPAFSLEPRWYYGIGKKVKDSFEAVHNSGNFLLLRVTFNPDWKIISTEVGRSVASNVSVIPTWGIRRMLTEKINFEAGIGMGYSYTIKSDFADPDRHIGIVNLHLRLGIDF